MRNQFNTHATVLLLEYLLILTHSMNKMYIGLAHCVFILQYGTLCTLEICTVNKGINREELNWAVRH